MKMFEDILLHCLNCLLLCTAPLKKGFISSSGQLHLRNMHRNSAWVLIQFCRACKSLWETFGNDSLHLSMCHCNLYELYRHTESKLTAYLKSMCQSFLHTMLCHSQAVRKSPSRFSSSLLKVRFVGWCYDMNKPVAPPYHHHVLMKWFHVKSGTILRQRSCILQLQMFISSEKMWDFVVTVRCYLPSQPTAVCLEQVLKIPSQEQGGDCFWWWSCFLFSTFHEENFFHLCKWASLHFRLCEEGKRRNQAPNCFWRASCTHIMLFPAISMEILILHVKSKG